MYSKCESSSLPNGFVVLPNFAAVICVFPGSKMVCILSFPFLTCLPSYFSMELSFYVLSVRIFDLILGP